MAADRGQGPAHTDSVDQSLLACHAVRYRYGRYHIYDAAWRPRLSNRLRLREPSPGSALQRWRQGRIRSRGRVRRSVLLAADEGVELTSAPRKYLSETMRAARHRPLRSGYRSLRLRSRIREPVLACPGTVRSRIENVPLAVRREMQPSAPVLGRVGSRRYPLLGPHGAAASRRDTKPPRLGDARGLFARSEQL